MAPHSSTLAWRIPWMEEPGRLESTGSLRVGHDWATSLSLSCIGEGNSNPLQYSCLENHMDGGAWWATVHGVAKSRTRLSDFTFTTLLVILSCCTEICVPTSLSLPLCLSHILTHILLSSFRLFSSLPVSLISVALWLESDPIKRKNGTTIIFNLFNM